MTIFKGDEVTMTIRIGIGDDMMKEMKLYSAGNVVRVKCRLGFTSEHQSLMLSVEIMEIVESVKVVIN